ncbi:MAG: hypothetical protein HUJ26_13920 [Planctomycetaceae bacterium]|nr:hypothetical protein [Planctomycetaceae bacterium]
MVLSMTSLAGAAEVQSGLQPGDAPPAFNVRDITGPKAGKTLCYRCMYGSRPVVSIFTREIDDNVASLIKQVDEQVGANGDKKMAAFVVLLTDDADAAEGKLKEVAEKNSIKNVPLTVYDGSAGPSSYKIAKDADVTVMMWNESDVKVNHAFAKGQLDKSKVKVVAGDSAKILE